ncbi:MAG TPA: hypothetical protein VNO79_03710 [Actinomycetota bacterium]|nr:hypothetical protein [Actinomycetota bacterium]
MRPDTALGGALRRVGPDVWVWTDTGERELRVRDLTLRELAPNYRVITYGEGASYVEVPELWRKDVSDADVEEALTHLLAEHGRPADIYAEGLAELLDDHRARSRGFLVPLEAWDREMSRVVGCSWDGADEEEIMARAERARAARPDR